VKKLLYEYAKQVEYLEQFFERGWKLLDCLVDGSAYSQADHRAIRFHFEEAERLWGRYSKHYLLAKRNSAVRETRLSTVIEALERDEAADTVALIGYNDGGLIALSNDHLALPGLPQDASWWSGDATV
jgi:hypothetical protein